MKVFSRTEKRLLEERMRMRGLAIDRPDALVMWGGNRRVLAVFDPETLTLRAFIRAD
jgi:hypothetical protein